jgi:hypothetical protein
MRMIVHALGVILAPLAAGAQAGKIPRIGWLMGGSPSSIPARGLVRLRVTSRADVHGSMASAL